MNSISAHSLFNIIIKVIGIMFLKEIIIAIPPLITVIYSLGFADYPGAFATLLVSLVIIFIYLLLIWFLVFKTDKVIDMFRLLDKVPEDPIPLNIHRSTVISISILVVGLLLMAQAIPMLVRELINWYQYTQSQRGFYASTEPFDYSGAVMHGAQIIIGLLLLGNQNAIVNYIELKQRKTKIAEVEDDEIDEPSN